MPPSSDSISVTCPQCQAMLTAKAEQIGTVITCSDCLEDFVVPAVEPTAPGPQGDPDPAPSASRAPTASGDDEALHRLLNPTLADHAGAADDRIRFDDEGRDEPPSQAHVPNKDYEFRITCRICGTRIHLDDSKIGQQVKCPDCYTSLDVQEPPPSARTPKSGAKPDDDLRIAPVTPLGAANDEFQLEDPTPAMEQPQVFRSIAEDLLQQAERELPDRTPARAAAVAGAAAVDPTHEMLSRAEGEIEAAEAEEGPELPAAPFRDGILKFLLDPTTAIMLVFLTLGMWLLLGSIQLAITLTEGGGIQQFGSVVCRMFAVVFGAAYGGGLAVSMQGIMQDTSNGMDKIETWPDLNFLDWMFDALFVVNAFFLAILPAAALTTTANMLGLPDALIWMIAILIGAVGVIFGFPFLLLSMLEAGSIFMPFSLPVFRSLKLATGAWIVFMIAGTGLVGVFAILLLGRIQWSGSSFGNVLFAAGMVCVAAIYFRFLGRLAWCAEEAVAEPEIESEESGGEAESEPAP